MGLRLDCSDENERDANGFPLLAGGQGRDAKSVEEDALSFRWAVGGLMLCLVVLVILAWVFVPVPEVTP